MNDEIDRWVLTMVGLSLTAAAAAAFAVAATCGGWVRIIVCSASLWWGTTGIAVALSAALSRPGTWPRDRRARYISGLAAAMVGAWLASVAAPWSSLVVLPVYALVERVSVSRLVPANASGAYAGLGLWLTYVSVGEALGYMAAAWMLSAVR